MENHIIVIKKKIILKITLIGLTITGIYLAIFFVFASFYVQEKPDEIFINRAGQIRLKRDYFVNGDKWVYAAFSVFKPLIDYHYDYRVEIITDAGNIANSMFALAKRHLIDKGVERDWEKMMLTKEVGYFYITARDDKGGDLLPYNERVKFSGLASRGR